MITLPGVTIRDKIYESTSSLVYRGVREQDSLPIILKVLKQDYPTPAELIRYRQEYEVTRSLNLEGVIKVYNQQDYQRTLVMMLEDFGGESLEKWMQDSPQVYRPIALPVFLRLAIKIAEILGSIHAANVIHKDINPSNIVLNPGTGQIKIIDFGISTRLSRINPTFKSPNTLEGTLAYLSPEQTGRMNRLLDYRTDFYSLGVSFYKLLTGQLPFQTTDVLELVHCHIAKQPVSLNDVNPAIPQAVSEIVMKLMAKNAEERYQSAWGIKADLEICLHQLETTGQISTFRLGTEDISEKFQIPQKLYGREEEIRILMAAFERVAGKRNEALRRKNEESSQFAIRNSQFNVEMMLVAGYSGIGKSVLVQELYKPITEKRGYFISGKFDQLQRNVPYSAIIEAFAGFVRHLLSESEIQLQQWRDKLLAALEVNGQIIVDVIPNVEFVIGKQPSVPEVGSTEAQNRFNLIFQKFIRVFCSAEHPLVIFLDDLQWVDSATLKLIELMMLDRETQHLFLIGAYRDNEVSQTHPLIITLEDLRKEGATVSQITLAPLESESIAQLIAETLHSDRDTVSPLADLVLRKTEGNPFFVNEFLKTLHAENLIALNSPQSSSGKGGWSWNLTQIEAKGITDNVVELMIGKLKKLPESVQHTLKIAACVGASFDLETLSIICERSPSSIYPDLVIAVQSGLLLPTSELDAQLLIHNYRFLHDRVQQAAYALIDENQRHSVHLQIGRLLLQHFSKETGSDRLFAIVDHLNLGGDLVVSGQERNRIARLNLMAAQKAKAATAYSAASKYAIAGIELLATDCWQHQYDLSLALHEEAVETAYLSGDFLAMQRWADIVLQQAITLLDKVKVYEVEIQARIAQGEQLAAVNTALVVLKAFGVEFPDVPRPSDVQLALEETNANLVGKQIGDLINLPTMEEPEKLAAMRILPKIISPCFKTSPELLLLIVSKQVNLSIQYGNVPLSSYAYGIYGLILCGVVLDIEAGYQFGELALSLLGRFNSSESRAKTFFAAGEGISHWRGHIRETLKLFQDGYQSGLETGDLEYAAYCACFTCQHSFAIGKKLPALVLDMETYGAAIEQIGQGQAAAFHYHKIFQQLVLNLIGRAVNRTDLMGDAYNEEELLPLHLQANDRNAIYFVFLSKLILCYLFGDFRQAAKNAKHTEEYLDSVIGMVAVPLFHFYDSLMLLSILDNATNSEKETWLNRVSVNQEKMHKWAHHAPMNYLHKFYLVEAEKARVLGQVLEAEEFYEQAISGAAENEFIQEEALAYELAAKFYLDRDRSKIAQTYMREAHYCYLCWGAKAKVADLEAKYPHWFAPSQPTSLKTSTNTIYSSTITNRFSDKALDLATVMKASQAIASEIVLEQLLNSLMKILIENAGAQIGFLILNKDGAWVIEASGVVNSDGSHDTPVTQVLQSTPIHNQLSASVINYVIRTKESVVVSDAAHESSFATDPYIKKHQTKSILCAPLIDQGNLVGVIYLENNLVVGAFTQDRVEVLLLLSGQAAISITNAKLYTERQQAEKLLAEYNRTLEQQVAERTHELAREKELLQTIFDRIPVMITLQDSQGQIQLINAEVERVYGWSRSEFETIDVLTKCYPDLEQRQRALEHMIAASGKWQDFRTQIRSGASIYTSWLNIRLSNGMTLGFGQDISDRKRAEEASILEERNRMAREIHDTLAQAFTGIIIHARSASSKVTADPEKAQTLLTQVLDLARSGLAEARRSVEALRRPYLLESSTLQDALSRLAAQLNSSIEAHIVYEVIGTPYPLSSDLENNLFRIGQEALTNAIKYAKANEIRIELVYEPTQCILRIKDDGQGFDVENRAARNGFGLLGMAERAERIRAELKIQSKLGQGTKIMVSIDQE